MIRSIVVDATPAKTGAALARIGGEGTILDVLPLGGAVLGSAQSDRMLQRTDELLARDDVDRVSTTVGTAVPQRAEWAFDQTVERAVSDQCEDQRVGVLEQAGQLHAHPG